MQTLLLGLQDVQNILRMKAPIIQSNGSCKEKSHQLEGLQSITLLGPLGNNCSEGETRLVNKI